MGDDRSSYVCPLTIPVHAQEILSFDFFFYLLDLYSGFLKI